MPMFDFAFLRSETSDRATLNIGGIANITWLPKGATENSVVAFDTGPGNMLLDFVSRRCFGEPFDRGGAHARSGKIVEGLLEEMLRHPYFAAVPPKTTGRELFGEQFVARMLQRIDHDELRREDALATLTELTARSVAESFRFTSSRRVGDDRASTFDLIMSGGGARNAFLVERLIACAPNARVVSSDTFDIPVSAKEAMAFAFFAKAFLEEIPIHLPRTTGARAHATLGTLAKAPRF
jgi:anhydro-N-acetylmuramic acid kinase